jgi:hypothetical protein
MRLTGGIVEFAERRNTGNYEHKEARLALNWVSDEGDEPTHITDWLEAMQATVRDAVRHQLYGAPKPATGPVHMEPAPTKAEIEAYKAKAKEEVDATEAPKAEAKVEGGKPPPKRGRPPKAKEEAKPVPVSTAEVDEPEDDPTTGVDEPEDDPTKGTAPEILDDDLNKLVRDKAHSLGDGKPVRQLIGRYVGIGHPIIELAQERRAAFLAELDALTKG